MPEFKQHVLVCDVVRDDERHCGDKGGGDVKKKFAEVLAANDLRNDVYHHNVFHRLLRHHKPIHAVFPSNLF